jgi:hypothetical protein
MRDVSNRELHPSSLLAALNIRQPVQTNRDTISFTSMNVNSLSLLANVMESATLGLDNSVGRRQARRPLGDF